MFLQRLKKFSKKSLIIFWSLGLALWQLPTAQAVSVYSSMNSTRLGLGDTVMVSIYIDSEDQEINVVEGKVKIFNSHKIVIKDFSLANSAFTYWPRRPSWSPTDQEITFVAGVPGGVKAKSTLLFKAIIIGQEAGQIIFSPEDFLAYANDGQATPVSVTTNALTFDVSDSQSADPRDEWNSIVSQDNKGPYNIIADLGQDVAVLSGQKFLSFSAQDDESGIAYYEIKEGDRDPVRAGSPYVLQNQTNNEPLIIIAYDKAGNSTQVLVKNKEAKAFNNYILLAVAALLLLVLSWIIYKFVYKKVVKNIKKE